MPKKQPHYNHVTIIDALKRVLGLELPTDALNFYNRLGTNVTLINDMSFIQGSTPALNNTPCLEGHSTMSSLFFCF
ncbi:MAG: hypothetical protein IJZ16_12950 [Clostridia bacterium]|nr:hypothetical protein [Clostridia bacterium]